MKHPGRPPMKVILALVVVGLEAVLVSAQQPASSEQLLTSYLIPPVPGARVVNFYGNNNNNNAPMRRARSILQNFAVDRMLKDKGFVRSIINCVLDKGPCESNGRKLRLMAPEILRGQCPGCSRTVHNQIRRVISHVQRNFPVEWSEVTRRFMSYNNPTGQDYGVPQAPNGYNPDPNAYPPTMYG